MAFIYTVPENHCVLVMRFRKFARVQHSGLHFRMPFSESLHQVPAWGDHANQRGHFLALTEQQSDTSPRQCQTRDNVTVSANASIYWRITDPVKACFEVDALPDVIEDVALNSLRSNIGKMELDEVLGSRETLNRRVAHDLKEASEGWGVLIKRAEIQELTIDEHTRRAMTQQMEAERRRRAQIAESEGEAEAAVNVARAEKEAAIHRAEGQAKALREMAEAEAEYLRALKREVSPEDAARILLAEKYIEGFRTISRNPADKVFLPSGVEALVSTSGGRSDGRRSRREGEPGLRSTEDRGPLP